MVFCRKSRINSSNIVKSEPQSQDESSNTVPSCPSTPVSAPPDVSNTPPSFKFLKTKKVCFEICVLNTSHFNQHS